PGPGRRSCLLPRVGLLTRATLSDREVLPMPAAKGGEAKTGLIITLVFFIVLSIILGVLVYLGYAGQDELAAKEKKAAEAEKNMAGDRDWNKFRALLYQAYMGYPPKDLGELGDLRERFDKGLLTGKDKDEVAKLVKQLDANFNWNAARKSP